MGIYWSVTALEVDVQDLSTSDRLAHRTRLFLARKEFGTTTAIEYTRGVIRHFAARHRVKHPGSVMVSGDFNWADTMDRQEQGYQGTSRIDRFLLKSKRYFSAGFNNIHEFLLGTKVRSPPTTLLADRAGVYSGRSINLETQSPSPGGSQAWAQAEKNRTVDKYISKLRELNTADGRTSNVTPAEATQTLLRLSKNEVKAIPTNEQTALHRRYFVDCWSPTMVSLDAH